VKKIALIGLPNSGKTVLFNALTHSNQRVANFSGVTIQPSEANLKLKHYKDLVTIVDLPGAYSLNPYSEDEKVLLNALQNEKFDLALIVVDSTKPQSSVRFILEVLNKIEIPSLIVFNLIDLASKQGFEYDFKKASQIFGVQVLGLCGIQKKSVQKFLEILEENLNHEIKRELPSEIKNNAKSFNDSVVFYYKKAEEITKSILKKEGKKDLFTEKLDKIVLHPFLGFLILILVLGLTFQFMFNFAKLPMGLIDEGFKYIASFVEQSALPEGLRRFLSEAVIKGVGSTIVFLPQILILFFLILFLEDFGFLARAVFLLDNFMSKVGLNGKSFLPLLSSYACAVPGILSTRMIENRKDKILTILIIPITTCSARIPVYTLLISAFIPNLEIFFGIKLQGLVMLLLYVLSAVFALLMGFVLKKIFFLSEKSPLLIELPSYKWPSFRSIFKGLIFRAKLFLIRVGTVIVSASIFIWILLNFPNKENSFAYKIGHTIEPIMKPIGFDWKLSTALIPTFAAREVMVSALSTIYLSQDIENEAKVNASKESDKTTQTDEEDTDRLYEVIKKQIPLPTGLSLISWLVFAPLCISTISTARRELSSNKWTLFLVVYLFSLAYLASFLTYSISMRFF